MPSRACERKALLLSRLQRKRRTPVWSFLYRDLDGHASPDAAPLLTAHIYDPEVERYFKEDMTCLTDEQHKVFICKLHKLHSRDKDKKLFDPCFDKCVLAAARAVQLDWERTYCRASLTGRDITYEKKLYMTLLQRTLLQGVVIKPVTPNQSYQQLLEMLQNPLLCDTALKSLSRRWCIDELAEYGELAGGSAATPPASAPATLGPCGLPAEFAFVD